LYRDIIHILAGKRFVETPAQNEKKYYLYAKEIFFSSFLKYIIYCTKTNHVPAKLLLRLARRFGKRFFIVALTKDKLGTGNRYYPTEDGLRIAK